MTFARLRFIILLICMFVSSLTGTLAQQVGGSSAGRLEFFAATGITWNSSTSGNSIQTIMPFNGVGGAAILLQLNQTTTITTGAITFEGTYDGTNWIPLPVAQVLNASTFSNLTNPYTLVASTNQPFLLLAQGFRSVRLRLSTQITGTGVVTPFVTMLPFLPVDPGLLNPIICPVGGCPVAPIASATGGAAISSAIAPATPAGVNLKATAGTLYAVQATTIQSTPVYVKFYNSASAPTCGSGTPVARFMVPVAATAANGAGSNISLPISGVAFSSGIGYCVTGALPDADTTAITANNTLVNIEWQ